MARIAAPDLPAKVLLEFAVAAVSCIARMQRNDLGNHDKVMHVVFHENEVL